MLITYLVRVASVARCTLTILPNIRDKTVGVLTTGSRVAEGQHWLLHWHTALDGVNGLAVAGLAGAALHVVNHDAVRVGTAGVRLALLHGLHAGQSGRVALEPGQAVADGPVTHHPASRVGATHAATALLSVNNTPDEGVAGLATRAGADGVATVHLAHGVDAAGRGHARVRRGLDRGAANVRVARIT